MRFADGFGVKRRDVDRMHAIYGSTIRGMQMEGFLKTEEDLHRFYRDVYKLKTVERLLTGKDGAQAKSGYHFKCKNAIDVIRKLPCRKIIASNSPIAHVRTILSCLGAADIPWERIYTPDTW